MTETKQWDVVTLLKTTTTFFSQKGVHEPKLTTELLLADVLRLSRMELFLAFDRPIEQNELDAFRNACKRRLQGEPVQYILGIQNFFGYDFVVNPSVLIPRPETELLVEEVIEYLNSQLSEKSSTKILDIGTGSGVIPISVLKKCETVRAVAVDVSKEALAVALQNAKHHRVIDKIEFLESDVLSENFCSLFPTGGEGHFSAVISNPPYIPNKERNSIASHVLNYEPHLALFSESGFEFYEKISKDAAKLLTPGGKLFFELHADGASRVKEMVSDFGFVNIVLKKDYEGFQRILIAEKISK